MGKFGIVCCALALMLNVISQEVEDKVKRDAIQQFAFIAMEIVVMTLCVEVYG